MPGLLTPATQHVVPRTLPDERAARRTLLGQVAQLEADLSQLFCSTWPRKDFEELRDDLVARVQHSRRALSDRTYGEEQNRRLIEEMLLEPRRHKWRRVASEDIGEPGCRTWHVRPRFGLLGMLMGWWRVVISSGCPLPN